MIAAVRMAGSPDVVALHRTFLRADGSGKIPVEPAKKSWGPVWGGAVHLGDPSGEVAVTEGLETGMSVQQATGLPTWAALSCWGIKRLKLPATIHSVLIFADHDPPGLSAAREAAERWAGEGRRVRLVKPPRPGFDFNDLLREA